MEEKLIEEQVGLRLKTRVICGRHYADTPAFDALCDCDAIVVMFGEIEDAILWAVKVAYTLHKTIYVLQDNVLREVKEVIFKQTSKGGDYLPQA